MLNISLGKYTLELVEDLTYLGSTIFNNLSLEADISKRIGKAASAVSRLCKRVWENDKLTTKTNISVYNDCVEQPTLWQRNLEKLCLTRTSPQQFPSALPVTHLGYILAGQSIQEGCSRAGEHSKRVRVAVPETPTLGRPCLAHEGWTPSKGCPLR